ncbi:hypothetical protein RJO15_17975 [Herbaspirillum huttiense F1]|uniref:Preprotein translocase subunit TatA n=2 Tax=Oxalobacteraceae TaxID=75682 RepID=A0ABU2ERQ0_9BURK|nr:MULTISPECIES: hypothetical protein [Herbaspirillum]MBP1315022.1 hypothetical protein [Herbaspirillum sp. 1130]MDR6742192.1 hypothetical protein [Herbaspirillum sp. 1173]MDR9850402.1 hypothetical protein [Herbaspirillum huttiense SE1]MDT0357681.1 hypothetical protein [Herbaspirillum huttiense F1]
MSMDGLDQITLVLLVILVVVALLFPLSDGRLPRRDRDRERPGTAPDEQSQKRR